MHRTNVLLLAAVACTSCILLVDNAPSGDQFSSTCTVASGTACGACIDNSCGAQLTTCCGDSACRGTLASIDQCADAGTCVVDTSSTPGAALEACIAAKCSVCQIAPLTAYDAGVYCSNDPTNGFCQCSTESILGQATTRCDTTNFPNSMCCADQGWPSSGSCTCAPMACGSQTDGCMCIWDNGVSTISSCDGSWGTCCMTNNDCTCTSNACDSFSTPVANCMTPVAAYCHAGQRMVSNCSAF